MLFLFHAVDSLKKALLLHVNKWFKRCGYYIETKYSDKLREVSYFINDKLEKFSFPILELSDVQRAMKVKDEFEEKSYEIDISIQPINVSLIIPYCCKSVEKNASNITPIIAKKKRNLFPGISVN